MSEQDIDSSNRRFAVIRRSSRLIQRLVSGKDTSRSNVSTLIDSSVQEDTIKQIVMIRMFGYKLLVYKE